MNITKNTSSLVSSKLLNVSKQYLPAKEPPQYTINFYSNYTPLVRHFHDVDKVKSASSFTAFTFFFFSLLTASTTPHYAIITCS